MSRFLPPSLRKMKSPILLAVSFTLLSGLASLERAIAAEEKVSPPPGTTSLFNGDDLGHWQPIEFDSRGSVHVSFDGDLTLEAGVPFTGVVWTGDPGELPRSNYEISLEAIQHYGDDFFCGLTFPVAGSYATLIVGGWGGGVVGISSINDEDASINETSLDMSFKRNQWYRIRLRVTGDHLQGWLDDKEIFKVALAGKKIGLRPGEIEKCVPLGLATYRTRAAFRNIELRRLPCPLTSDH